MDNLTVETFEDGNPLGTMITLQREGIRDVVVAADSFEAAIEELNVELVDRMGEPPYVLGS